MLTASRTFFHLSPVNSSLWAVYPHFTSRTTKPQRGKVTTQSYTAGVSWDCNPGKSDSRDRILGCDASQRANVSHLKPRLLYLLCDAGGDSAHCIFSASWLCHEGDKGKLQGWRRKEGPSPRCSFPAPSQPHSDTRTSLTAPLP